MRTQWKVKKKLLCIILTIALILIAIGMFLGCLLYPLNIRGITAKEGLKKANSIAKNWRQDAILIKIHSAGDIYYNGKATRWRYSYAETFPMTNSTKGYDVIISYDGSYTTHERTYPPARYPLSNWAIDSDEAMKIAKDNPTISTYLSTYKGATIESMALGANQTCSGWTIEWIDMGFMDDPHSAKIRIDANTGEVIYVEAQMH